MQGLPRSVHDRSLPRIRLPPPIGVDRGPLHSDVAIWREYECVPEFKSDEIFGAQNTVSGQIALSVRYNGERSLPTISYQLDKQVPVRAIPSVIYLEGLSKESQPRTRTVVLVASDVTDWAIVDVRSNVPWVTAKIDTAPSGPHARRFNLVAGAHADGVVQGSAELTVTTTHPDCPELQIQVTAD